MRTLLSKILFTVALAACTPNERSTEPPLPAPTASSVVAPLLVPSAKPVAPEPVLVAKGEYTTKFAFRGEQAARGENVVLIAQRIHGTVIQPGAEWSFNEAVGPRTLERGFKAAPSLFLGEVTESVGGGTCQVSSTLYAASLHAGVETLQRRPHSRPSKYIPMGLDAAVNYPKQCWDAKKPDLRICLDLVLKNPFDYPITISMGTLATQTDKKLGLVAVFLSESADPPPKLTLRWESHRWLPFPTRYRVIRSWLDDRKKRKQRGARGHRGALHIVRDGKDDWVHATYQPVPEVFLVGQAFEIPEEMNGAEDDAGKADDVEGVEHAGGQGGASGRAVAERP
jgi:hypothetical protein